MRFRFQPEFKTLKGRRYYNSLIEQLPSLLAFVCPVPREVEEKLFKLLHFCRWKYDSTHDDVWQTYAKAIVERLAEVNIPIVKAFVRRLVPQFHDPDDVFVSFLFVLNRALISYDPWRTFKFSTYLVCALKSDTCKILRKRKLKKQHITGCDWKLLGDDLVAAEKDEEPEALDQVHSMVKEGLVVLDDREYDFIHQRFLSKHPRKLREIAEDAGVCKERVRQIIDKALLKLRSRLQESL